MADKNIPISGALIGYCLYTSHRFVEFTSQRTLGDLYGGKTAQCENPRNSLQSHVLRWSAMKLL